MLREAHTKVPSCPVVNLQYGRSMAEIALLKGLPRCDSLFESAYERFKASLTIKPLGATYTTYIQVSCCSVFLLLPVPLFTPHLQMLKSHAAIKRSHSQLDEAQRLENLAAEVAAEEAADDHLVDSSDATSISAIGQISEASHGI